MSAGPGPDSGLWVPFLVDPDHEDLAQHIERLLLVSIVVFVIYFRRKRWM
jgi:hypothetical protein